MPQTCRRHNVETRSSLLALNEGNPAVNPIYRGTLIRSFDVFLVGSVANSWTNSRVAGSRRHRMQEKRPPRLVLRVCLEWGVGRRVVGRGAWAWAWGQCVCQLTIGKSTARGGSMRGREREIDNQSMFNTSREIYTRFCSVGYIKLIPMLYWPSVTMEEPA